MPRWLRCWRARSRRFRPELQDPAFAQIVKRADWSMALVEAIKGGKVTLANLGPSSVHRLRTHSDKAVAKRAGEVIDELRGPEVKEKNALIAKLTPEVEKPGNIENGKKLFTANCIICHRFNGEGKEIGPELTGMGAHGPAELLVAFSIRIAKSIRASWRGVLRRRTARRYDGRDRQRESFERDACATTAARRW